MRLTFRVAAFAVTFLSLAIAGEANATPPDGDWVEVTGVLYPPGSRETYGFSEVTRGGVTTFNISVSCGAAPCPLTTTNVTEYSPTVTIAGAFSALAPKRYFIFFHNETCTTPYGPAAYLGLWSDTGGAPYIVQCFVPRRLSITPRGIGPHPIGPPNLPPIRIPPLIQRPAPIGPGPAPGPIPPH
ncbi:MAG: hypothetical protein WAU68_12615 [Vitreimonas sp.]